MHTWKTKFKPGDRVRCSNGQIGTVDILSVFSFYADKSSFDEDRDKYLQEDLKDLREQQDGYYRVSYEVSLDEIEMDSKNRFQVLAEKDLEKISG